MNDFVKSRRFWAIVASIVVVVFRERFEQFGLTEDKVQLIVLSIGSWVVGESLRSSQAVSPVVVPSPKEPSDVA